MDNSQYLVASSISDIVNTLSLSYSKNSFFEKIFRKTVEPDKGIPYILIELVLPTERINLTESVFHLSNLDPCHISK